MIKVLLIDDDLIDQMAIQRVIEQLANANQYLVDSADAVASAKTILAKETFDIIICDYNLGDGTVIDLLPLLHNKNWILLTGDDSDKIDNTTSLGQCKLKLHKDFHLQYLNDLTQYLESQLSILTQKKTSNPPPLQKNAAIKQLLQTFDNNETVVKELIDVFMEQNPIDMEKLELAIEQKNLTAVQNIAHRLKSGFALLGFPDLSSLAAQIEQMPSSPNVIEKKIIPLHNELIKKTKQAYLQLKKFKVH